MRTDAFGNDIQLTPFRVSFFEEAGDRHTLSFFCMAEDEDHAEEQTLDAYPSSIVRHIEAIDPEDYPYPCH